MHQSENNEYIQLIRALALVISEQTLEIRQKLSELAHLNIDKPLEFSRQQCPHLDWHTLIQAKLDRYAPELDSAISIFESSYPESLKQIVDPVWLLFYKGAAPVELVNKKCVAIVGSRRADYTGLELAEQFALTLAQQGVSVVSGLALGIDTAAHIGALKAGLSLSTIAVLGSGLNIVYPLSNKELYSEIISKQGMILSQFEPDSPPYPSNFLNRNRIVSGLSTATIVIQASLRSGSLVTAKHSIEQGKDVYVVPGDIDNIRYQGSNKLIQQGAQLITGIDNLMEHLGLCLKTNARIKSNSNPDNSLKSEIIKILQEKGETKVDQMLRLLGSVSLEKELLELEIGGVIERLPGNVLKIGKF